MVVIIGDISVISIYATWKNFYKQVEKIQGKFCFLFFWKEKKILLILEIIIKTKWNNHVQILERERENRDWQVANQRTADGPSPDT